MSLKLRPATLADVPNDPVNIPDTPGDLWNPNPDALATGFDMPRSQPAASRPETPL